MATTKRDTPTQSRSFPGLPAHWLNGWMAAVGATVLVEGLTLQWSDDPEPVAVLTHPSGDTPSTLIEQALRNLPPVESWPIARQYPGLSEIGLNLDVGQFDERAQLARTSELGWMISSLYSDARIDRKTGQTPDKGPFLTSMPGKANTPADRLEKIVDAALESDISRSLFGFGELAQMFGVGFDLTRIGSTADDTHQWVDPVIEALVFFGLRLFPVRGSGGLYVRQRGWLGESVGKRRFWWPAWSDPLDRWGVDALLDHYSDFLVRRDISQSKHPKRWPVAFDRLSIFAHYISVPYEPTGSSDTTRGYGSIRMGSRVRR